MNYYKFIRPILFQLPPEKAHSLAFAVLKSGVLPARNEHIIPSLQTSVWDYPIANPVGLAAGFDKNAAAIEPLCAQGFGFIEMGTVTPLPQPGNPKPRMFRLTRDKAIINRLGFNNHGLQSFVKNLKHARKYRLIGANIGKNKDSADATADYLAGLEAVYPYADYITVNISSPNTEGLRDLQQKGALNDLLDALLERKATLTKTHRVKKPLLVKIAPDISQDECEHIAQIALEKKLDGLIISNTTIARPETLKSRYKDESGGLSGAPVFERSTKLLKDMYRFTGGKIPLIGVGGISSGADAYQKIKAGASLVQLYSALIYGGFDLVDQIKDDLAYLLEKDGFTNIRDAVGVEAK